MNPSIITLLACAGLSSGCVTHTLREHHTQVYEAQVSLALEFRVWDRDGCLVEAGPGRYLFQFRDALTPSSGARRDLEVEISGGHARFTEIERACGGQPRPGIVVKLFKRAGEVGEFCRRSAVGRDFSHTHLFRDIMYRFEDTGEYRVFTDALKPPYPDNEYFVHQPPAGRVERVYIVTLCPGEEGGGFAARHAYTHVWRRVPREAELGVEQEPSWRVERSFEAEEIDWEIDWEARSAWTYAALFPVYPFAVFADVLTSPLQMMGLMMLGFAALVSGGMHDG